MSDVKISMIVACARNRTIGLDGGMPWHVSGDLKFFKQATLGKPVIMGRKTYQSIGGPLPGRANIVITRDKNFSAPGIDVVHTLDQAIRKAKTIATIDGAGEVMIIGGAEIYQQALALADRIYMTRIDMTVEGDAFFPELDDDQWQQTWTKDMDAENPDGPAYRFCRLDRLKK